MNRMEERIIKKTKKTIGPTIHQMIDAGVEKGRIIDAIQNHVDNRIKQYYKKQIENTSIYTIIVNSLKDQAQSPDSKAETILYHLLEENKIEFKFQYQIGPYKVDFLINEFLVLELDGPMYKFMEQQKKDTAKDRYLEKMGYKILRIPIYILTIDVESVIDGIKELCRPE